MVKNLLLWIVIAMVLLTVFRNVSVPNEMQVLDYSQFIDEVQADQVRRVEIEGFSIYGSRTDGSQFKTIRPYYVEDPKLIDDLLNHKVEIQGREPEQQALWHHPVN